MIVGSESGDIFALDRKNGKIDWQVHTAGAVKGGLALDDGVLYGANYAGQVFAIKASSGQYVWQSSTQGSSFGRGGPVYSTPAVAYGRVFLGSIDSRVYSFDEYNGELALEPLDRRLGLRGPGRRRHAEDRSRPSTSAPRTRTSTRSTRRPATCAGSSDIGGVILGAASVLGEIVYVAGLGPNVGTFGFNVKTGKKVFESDLGEYNPVISDGHRMYLTGTRAASAPSSTSRARSSESAPRTAARQSATASRRRTRRSASARSAAHEAKHEAARRKAHEAKQQAQAASRATR